MDGHGNAIKRRGPVAEVVTALRMLIERFPDCFSWNDHRPLKIGIHKNLEARGVDPRLGRLGVSRYCRHLAYQHALVEGAARIDLDGQPAGVVTHKEAAFAAKNYTAMLGTAMKKRETLRKQAVRERKTAAEARRPTVRHAAVAALPAASLQTSLAELRAAARQRRDRDSASRG
jgi:sRNA-binding protein